MSGYLLNVSRRTGYIELPEIVVAAAARQPETDLVIMSKRHGSPDFFKVADKIFETGTHYHDWEQGFVTNRREFVTREEAWEVAKSANQIRRVTGTPGTLYSEDLY